MTRQEALDMILVERRAWSDRGITPNSVHGKKLDELLLGVLDGVSTLANLALRSRDPEVSVVELRSDVRRVMAALGAHAVSILETKC